MADTTIQPPSGSVRVTGRLSPPVPYWVLLDEVRRLEGAFLGVAAKVDAEVGAIEVLDPQRPGPAGSSLYGRSQLGWTLYLPGEASIVYGV